MSKKQDRVSLARFKELVSDGEKPEGKVLVAKAMAVTVDKGLWPEDEEEAKTPEAEGALNFIASTEVEDRSEDIIEQRGWDLENFRKGGTFLWAHDGSLPPIGKPLRVEVSEGKLLLQVKFTPADMDHPLGMGFGDTIRRMYEEGFMRAVSVGFGPLEVEMRDSEESDWGLRFVRQELHEVSAVPVPANPEALHVAESKGINVTHLYNWAEEVKACGMSSEALAWADKTWASQLLDTYQSKAVAVPEAVEATVAEPVEESSEEPAVDLPTVKEVAEEIEDIVTSDAVEETSPTVEPDNDVLEPTIECEYEAAVTKTAEVESRVFEELHKLAAMVAKQGRVLSASNERKLREAFDLLSSVLSAVTPEEEGKACVDCSGCGCGTVIDAPPYKGEPEDKGLSEDEFRALIKRSVENKLSAFKAEITGQLAE